MGLSELTKERKLVPVTIHVGEDMDRLIKEYQRLFKEVKGVHVSKANVATALLEDAKTFLSKAIINLELKLEESE